MNEKTDRRTGAFRRRRGWIPLFLFALLLIPAIFALSAAADGTETDTLRWCPLYYTDEVFFETLQGSAVPEEASALVIERYARPNEDGSFTGMAATGEWSYDRASGVCRPLYAEEETDYLYVTRRAVETERGVVYDYRGGSSLTELQDDLFLRPDRRFILTADIVIPHDGYPVSEEVRALSESFAIGHSLLIPGDCKVEFDLNGYKLQQTAKWYLFHFLESRGGLVLFSSRPGGLLNERDVLGNPDVPSLKNASHYSWSAGIFGMEGESNTLSVGSYEGHPGANLTMRGGVMISASDPSAGGSILFDGVTAHGEVADSSALFVIRTYGGSCAVRNSDVYITVKGYETFSPINRAMFHLRTTSDSSPIVDKVVYVDNCRLFCALSGNTIVNQIDEHGTLVVTNTVGNYSMTGEGALLGKLVVGAGNAYSQIGEHPNIVLAEGVLRALNRKRVQCDITFPDPCCYDDTREDGRYYDYQDERFTLDDLTEYGTGSETVRVTWMDLSGGNKLNETYVKGGDAVYVGTRIRTTGYRSSVAYQEIDGWDGVTENLQESVIFKPNLIAFAADVVGLKHNVALSSDFILQFFVPKYQQIADITDERGKRFSRTEIELDGVAYDRIQVEIPSNDVTRAATFRIVVDESGEFMEQTISFSVLDYAKEALAREEIAEKDKALIAAAMAYAEASAKYFNGSAPEELSAFVTEASSLLPSLTETDAERIGENAAVLGAAFDLDASPDLILYIKDGFKGALRIYYTADGKPKKSDFTLSGSTASVVLSDVGVSTLAEGVSIEIRPDGETAFTEIGRYTLAAYAAYCRENTSPEMADLAAAFLRYAEAAKAAK